MKKDPAQPFFLYYSSEPISAAMKVSSGNRVSLQDHMAGSSQQNTCCLLGPSLSDAFTLRRRLRDIKSLLKSIVVSNLMATGLIEEMDLNPVSLYLDGAMILDAKMSLRNPAWNPRLNLICRSASNTYRRCSGCSSSFPPRRGSKRFVPQKRMNSRLLPRE
jgi:hypothetical protein